MTWQEGERSGGFSLGKGRQARIEEVPGTFKSEGCDAELCPEIATG